VQVQLIDRGAIWPCYTSKVSSQNSSRVMCYLPAVSGGAHEYRNDEAIHLQHPTGRLRDAIHCPTCYFFSRYCFLANTP
jgi:hypothetical protein